MLKAILSDTISCRSILPLGNDFLVHDVHILRQLLAKLQTAKVLNCKKQNSDMNFDTITVAADPQR